VLKKASPQNLEAVDVPADNLEGTMDRFADGLRRVLTAPKLRNKPKPRQRMPRLSTT
jgi:hypothetical protein